MAKITFVEQAAPVEEYGRALYAVSRSILRAHLDQIGRDDLEDLNVERTDVTLRQLGKVARLERDKGSRGDGFEWAVHEAILGQEPRVVDPISIALSKVSRHISGNVPKSLLFGHERAKHLGFLDAVVEAAGAGAVLLADGRGHPPSFGPWVSVAAQGHASEAQLPPRIKKVWKTDLFLTDEYGERYAAATVKSNHKQLEGGAGLRLGIVPEATDLPIGLSKRDGLWVLALGDPNGFMGLFNDAYGAVASALLTLGKLQPGPYYAKPSAKAQKVIEQLLKYPTAKVMDIEAALDEAAQADLVQVTERLLSVEAPAWLHLTEKSDTSVIAPKPSFVKLD